MIQNFDHQRPNKLDYEFGILSGANMDIDLSSSKDQVSWEQDQCPWNQEDDEEDHRCAVKNTSICPYFCGINYLDTVLCCYPNRNPYLLENKTNPEVDVKGPLWGKSRECEPVVRSLPEWFGIEEAIRQYLDDIDAMPTFLANIDSTVVGFLTIKEHNSSTAEIQIMAVAPGYHRCGIGTGLLISVQYYLLKRGIEFLQVKTLSDSHPDENYARTRAFYASMGFKPMEEFLTLWGTENPCLQMIKSL
jgi:GNAT superfamily N-acetyltransferase